MRKQPNGSMNYLRGLSAGSAAGQSFADFSEVGQGERKGKNSVATAVLPRGENRSDFNAKSDRNVPPPSGLALKLTTAKPPPSTGDALPSRAPGRLYHLPFERRGALPRTPSVDRGGQSEK